MNVTNQPRMIQSTPMVPESNMQATDEARRSMLGKHSVSAAELHNLDKLESFQRSGLVAMQDHENASKSKLALTGSAVKGFAKLLLSFKIFQTVADGALFLHGRLTKEPFHARMDEKLETIMHGLSKGYTADVSKFDPESYVACMDNFVLGDNLFLPDASLTGLNRLLVDMLINPDEHHEGVEEKAKQFIVDNQRELNSSRLNREIVPEIEKGHGILTPKILLAKLVHDLKNAGGDIDKDLVSRFADDCKKTVGFYDRLTAMSLYSKSIDNTRILEAAARKELTKLEKCREALDVTTDFLMRFVPFIYMFVVANMIIDRNVSGATKTDNFNEWMDEKYSHLNETTLEQIKDFAGNYFTTGKVDEFGLKWGNLMPTTMAISLYFLSTFRLGITVVSPKNESTYVNHAIEQLTKTYESITNPSGEKGPPKPPGGAGHTRMRPAAYQQTPMQPAARGQQPALDTQRQANIPPDGAGGQPQVGSDPQPATGNNNPQPEGSADAAPATEAGAQEPASQETAGLPSSDAQPESVSTADLSQQQAVGTQLDPAREAKQEPGEFKMTLDSGEKVSMADLARDPDKYNLSCSDVVRAYFDALEGAKETKYEKIYRTFSGGLIGVRALNNVAFEGKDATPDVPIRDWFYDNVCTRIIIPLSCIENRGVVDNMVNEQEKARLMDVFGKVFNNQPLTKENEDFLQGVINSMVDGPTGVSSTYGFRRSANHVLTGMFMILHMGILFADFATAVGDPDGKSSLDPLFQKSMGLLNVGLVYKLFYRPVLEVINMGTFAYQHGLKNMSRYFMLAAWNVIGRSITSAPALPLWNLNTTNYDTLATLVDSAGTTGHDQSTHTNLRKATLESNINQSKTLLHSFVSTPQLWEQAFDESSSPDALRNMDDFAGVLSQRLDLVAKDLEMFSQTLQVEQPDTSGKPDAPYEMKAYV